jgi:hypothetical protein
MPTIPMIVPLLVTGILVGYILRTKRDKMGRKLIILGSLLGGAGNAVNAAILYLFQRSSTVPANLPANFRTFARQTMPTQSLASFVLLSFIVGILIVLLVLIPATIIHTRKLSFLKSFVRRGERDEL